MSLSTNMSLSTTAESEIATEYVLICQNRTCLKQGAAQVLAAFQALPVSAYKILGTACLGHCGNGPMVYVSDQHIWYGQVQPEEVPAIVERHLKHGCPVLKMLYHNVHTE